MGENLQIEAMEPSVSTVASDLQLVFESQLAFNPDFV